MTENEIATSGLGIGSYKTLFTLSKHHTCVKVVNPYYTKIESCCNREIVQY
jgi:hypothetical protein